MAQAEDPISDLQRILKDRDARIEALNAQLAELQGSAPAVEQPSEIDLSFTSLGEWEDWFNSNPWTMDESYIRTVIDWALTHGVEDSFLGFARPDQVSVTDDNFRETFFAHGMNPRLRAVLHMVNELTIRKDSWMPRIYGTEALTPFALLMRGRFARYIGSEYAPTAEDQARIYPIPHQDAMNLSFPDESFDMILSNEVLEHVPLLERALAEAARVLAPDGVLLATFPFAYVSAETMVRAVLKDGKIVHLCEPEYHGNPMDPEAGSLVFQIPAWDILPMAVGQGFRSAEIRFVSSKTRGIIGAGLAGIFVLKAVK
jgi:Methyltransferase domain